MKLKLKELGTSAVYGLVDIGAEIADQNLAATMPNISKPFQNVTDLSRAVAVGAGLVLPYVSRNKAVNDLAETVSIAAIPLLEKSIYKAVRTFMSPTGRYEGRLVLRNAGTVQQMPITVPSNGVF